MQPVRQRILEILRGQDQVTVAQLGRELGMAPVSVRHHLEILQSESLIRASGVQRQGRVGRPKQVYELTEEANQHFPDNFRGLTRGLLSELKETMPRKQVIRLLERATEQTVAELTNDWCEDQPIEDRLNEVVCCLSEMGYLACWEKVNGDYLVHTQNCPYAGMAEEHGELCDMDMGLIERLTGDETKSVARVVDGHHRCSYLIEGQPAPAANGPAQ